MTMSEVDMEQYAQWLDELCEKDPQAYAQLMKTMKQQLAEAEAAGDKMAGDAADDTATSILDAVKRSVASGGALPATSTADDAFIPQFPGNKVMDKDGLAAKQEGIHVDVNPGFVMKSRDVKNQKKVFVNICHAPEIQTFSQRKQLDADGKEQEGIHVPLSLGPPHETKDKTGASAVAFDVAVNTQVVEDCRADKTGSFRNFVCELALEYIDQKYQIKLDARYKLPKLSYRGDLPPPKHYIRKTQKPIIQDVSSNGAPAGSTKEIKDASVRPAKAKTDNAQLNFFEETRGAPGEKSRRSCQRVASVSETGMALSREDLERAATHLVVEISFQGPVEGADDVEIELRPEYLVVKAVGHHDLGAWLPYPVSTTNAEVVLNRGCNALEVTAEIDKTWNENEPDSGSAPWLLAQALRGDTADADDTSAQQRDRQPEPKSLVEMFHLAMPSNSTSTLEKANAFQTPQRASWDPVDDEEELPEDRFHRKDMMSMHILEQRRKEREQKQQEAHSKRKAQRQEAQEKQQRAREAGKTWREMYPNEPETTYIDMEDLIAQDKMKREKAETDSLSENLTTSAGTEVNLARECVPTALAQEAAAAWSQDKEEHGLNLASALAFDLLD